MIGKTVNIYGRNFLIYDCDMFTKTFYAKNFGVNNFEPISIQATRNEFPKMVKFQSGMCERKGKILFLGNSSLQWIWYIRRFITELFTSTT
jgi:hypothetical protein